MISTTRQHQMWIPALGNDAAAKHLDEIAQLLEAQGANIFRIAAYRKAARTLRDLSQPVQDIFDREGRRGLVGLEGIGRSIAYAIEQFIQTGKIPLLERLRGESAPERIFTTVADIGPRLAQRIHERLGIETLAELQAAAWDGRLTQVPGMGRKRVQAVRECIAGRLRYQRREAERPSQGTLNEEQSSELVAELLSIDLAYRHLAESDRLPRISPRRFNPEGKAWLPILHTRRGNRHYTALFSNTARAHEFGTTHDWVVIFRDDDAQHGRWTVITAAFGKLKGHRIIRGLEQQCEAYYAKRAF